MACPSLSVCSPPQSSEMGVVNIAVVQRGKWRSVCSPLKAGTRLAFLTMKTENTRRVTSMPKVTNKHSMN